MAEGAMVEGAVAPPDPTIVVEVRGLVTRFGRQTVHDGVDLAVRRGEVLAVIGGSGSGKSVLLRAILGLTRPAAGEIRLFDTAIGDLGRDEMARLRARTGVLFQDGALFSSLTVAENVLLPLKESARFFGELPVDLLEAIAQVKIAMVGLSADAGVKRPSELSGGMRKRAGLARALALDPEVLFLDEPTAGLDPVGAAGFDSLLKGLGVSLGLTVVLVTHDLDTLVALADRVAVLVDRRLVVGTLDEILAIDDPWIRDTFQGPRGRAARRAGG